MFGNQVGRGIPMRRIRIELRQAGHPTFDGCHVIRQRKAAFRAGCQIHRPAWCAIGSKNESGGLIDQRLGDRR
ncbi:hypothetical protein D3C72_2390450 [compost metagenome]